MKRDMADRGNPYAGEALITFSVFFGIIATIAWLWSSPNYRACQNTLIQATSQAVCNDITILHQSALAVGLACALGVIIGVIRKNGGKS